MGNEQHIANIETFVQQTLQEHEGLFLVEVRIRPTNNIKVFIDGDQGVSIDKCVRVNRQLYRFIEEQGWWPEGDFSLEVSSPGVDEPLRLLRQYIRNIGRQVEVVKADGTKTEGVLQTVEEAGIVVDETRGKNKKKEVVSHAIPFDQIKTTTVQVTF